MLIKPSRPWNLPERMVTPEALVTSRRSLLGAGVIGGAAVLGLGRRAFAADPAPGPYPPLRPITPEKDATTYNNYYEFSDDKDLWEAAQALPQKPWSISFDGLVAKPQALSLDDLMQQVQLEDRIYRHRCVEAWSMVVPWTGFPMAKLIALAQPTAAAKYVVFTTIADKKVMPGLRKPWYPWPYIDGLTMAEATNDVAFIVTGMYGKPLPPQNGGPIRIHVPWKYGFKSVKSFIKVTFTDQQPVNFWQKLQASEYGFWANVNPAVPHPRWSQATERVLGSNDRIPTLIYNGYGEWVADLYKNLSGERLFA